MVKLTDLKVHGIILVIDFQFQYDFLLTMIISLLNEKSMQL